MLILAAVSIATLTGENGILTRAQDASKQNTQGEEKEQIALAYDAAMSDNYANGNYGAGVTQGQLEAELKKYDDGIIVEPDEEDLKVKFPNGNVYTVKKDGTIEEPTTSKSENDEKNPPTSLPSTPETTPWLPTGTKSTEGDLDKGLVIIDKNDNEWVWVEVPKSIYKNEDYNTAGEPLGEEDYDKIEKVLKEYANSYTSTDYVDEYYDNCPLDQRNI